MPPIQKVQDQPQLIETRKYPYAKWKYDKFNPIQSRVFEFYDNDVNALIAASTSSGKTICAELFLAHEVRVRGGKGMFLGPLKALTQEKIDDWTDPNYHFSDKKVTICTGDYRLTPDRKQEFQEADLFVMTSEMLNHRSRNFKSEQNSWLQEIGTLVIDECLPPEALVLTENGEMPIGKIIDERKEVKVASFNHQTNSIEYKKIVGYKKKLQEKIWFSLYYKYGNITATENHMVWVEGRGYVPIKNISRGDIIYVKKQLRSNRKAKKCNIGNITRRRLYITEQTSEVSPNEVQSIGQAEGIGRVEVQRVERLGWNPAKNIQERRVRRVKLSIYNKILSGVSGFLSVGYNKWNEKGQSFMVGGDYSSNCFSSLVYGRWQSGAKSDVNSYGGFSKRRSDFISELARTQMGNICEGISHEDILGVTSVCCRKGQISRFDKGICNTGNFLQDFNQNGNNILFDVWQGIYSQSKGYSCCKESFVVREPGMSGEMAQNYNKDTEMDAEQSWCCDLEVEDNNNFFVNGVLVHNSHLLTVPERGHHLEVGLMKFTDINPNARIILLSATMPNVNEIGEWCSYVLNKKNTFVLTSQYRPCPLNTHYEMYSDGRGSYDSKEQEKIIYALDIVEHYTDDKFLIFVHTKRTGESMTKTLRAAGIICEYHNADLDKTDRIKLERRFREDKSLRVVVATSTLAWGLNMPARRVIVLGIHRGLQEVETYNIKQMVGRAGRPSFDPMGDAYILLPESKFTEQKERLKQTEPITSQLLQDVGGHYKVLAFHIVSEIHHGDIKVKDDVHRWYKRSLAHYQAKNLDEAVVDKTLDLLKACGAIRENGAELVATSIGTISSMFYYSPFDVSDLRRNFKNLFDQHKSQDDIWVAMALGNVDGQRYGICNKAEREEMGSFMAKVNGIFGHVFTDSCIKAGFAYHCLMNGHGCNAMIGYMRTLQWDFNRMGQVLLALDTMSGKWNKHKFFLDLQSRMTYGVGGNLVDLVKLPDVGKVRAKKLYDAGLLTLEDVAAADPILVRKVLGGLKKEKVEEIIERAKLSLLGNP